MSGRSHRTRIRRTYQVPSNSCHTCNTIIQQLTAATQLVWLTAKGTDDSCSAGTSCAVGRQVGWWAGLGRRGGGDALSGDGGDPAVRAPRLTVQVLGDELDVEGLARRPVSQAGSLLLLAGHDLEEDSNRGGLSLYITTHAHSRCAVFGRPVYVLTTPGNPGNSGLVLARLATWSTHQTGTRPPAPHANTKNLRPGRTARHHIQDKPQGSPRYTLSFSVYSA